MGKPTSQREIPRMLPHIRQNLFKHRTLLKKKNYRTFVVTYIQKGKRIKTLFQPKLESRTVHLTIKLKYFWWWFLWRIKKGCHHRYYPILLPSIFNMGMRMAPPSQDCRED